MLGSNEGLVMLDGEEGKREAGEQTGRVRCVYGRFGGAAAARERDGPARERLGGRRRRLGGVGRGVVPERGCEQAISLVHFGAVPVLFRCLRNTHLPATIHFERGHLKLAHARTKRDKQDKWMASFFGSAQPWRGNHDTEEDGSAERNRGSGSNWMV